MKAVGYLERGLPITDENALLDLDLPDPSPPAGRDLLVRVPSAYGRSRGGRTLFPGADVLHVGGTDHFGLLNHPRVEQALLGWLA